MHRQFLPLLMILIVGLFLVGKVVACSCIVTGTVDTTYQETPNIVILKLRSLEKYPADSPDAAYTVENIKRSILTVEKVFKGHLKVGQELPFRQGGGADCVWAFTEESIGSEFLLYLDAKPEEDGLWTGHVCSRSGSIQYRAADLLYMEKLPEVLGKSRISGKLYQEITTAVKGGYKENRLLSNRSVWISGNGKNIELKTDDNGVYEIYGLPPGKYKIIPEKVPGYKLYTYSDEKSGFEEIDLEKNSHEDVDFDFVIDNVIKGKFLDTFGNALRGVCMDLVPASGELAPYTYLSDCTDDTGAFKFTSVPAGSYVLVINDEDKVTASEPFSRFYYPNKKNREEAVEIIVGPGTYQRDLMITAPKTTQTVVYSGRLLFEDGKPVPNESILFYNDSAEPPKKDYQPDSSTDTNENGEFSLRILKGSQGYIFGSFMTFSGEYDDCLKLEKLIKATNETGVVSLETPKLKVSADSDLSGIELRLPFPSCKSAEFD